MFSCAGVDVSKDNLEVRINPQDVGASYPNAAGDFLALINWLKLYKVSRVLLEATGGYEREVMKALQAAGFEVLRCPEQDNLRALVQQRENFVQQQGDDVRRLKTASADTVKPLLQRHIDYLCQAIKSIEKLIRQSAKDLDSDKSARLCSVKGIGLVTAASVMAYLPELGEVGRHEIAALAGIAPYNDDSGKHNGKRHISGGRFAARRAMYMACWVVIQRQPDFKARYDALRQRGKCAKVALIACMRVLLIRLNAMIRDKTEWKEPVP